jgi:hypothetical protein
VSAFDTLRQFFAPKDTTIALASDPFVVVDRERAIEKLKLDARAERNGSQDFPALDSLNLDDVELEIEAEINEYATRAQIDASINHRIYGERLSELALLRELSTISGASAQALGDYQTTVINREGRLALAKDAIRESYQELADFKADHGLKRPAHRGILPLYALSTIMISWFVESALNTAFLRVNDEFGIVGGFIAAAIVAAVNVFISALIGRAWWPYLFHRDAARRRLAIAGSIAWAIALLVWNLLAGHFRDAKSAGLPDPEMAALRLFVEAPFQFESIYSYGLLIAGTVFAILAATAAFKMDDPYPGYGGIYRRHVARCEEYADEIERAMDELKQTRDEAIGTASSIRDELGTQFRERGQIIASRTAHRARFREHQDYLEGIGQYLLGHYRAANVRARADAGTPAHFDAQWRLKRTDLPLDPDEPSIDEEVARAQAALEHSITTIADAYREAIESFVHLDKIKRSLNHG